MSRTGGAWNVVRKILFAPVTIPMWAVVNFDSMQSRPEDVTKLIQMMSHNMRTLGQVLPFRVKSLSSLPSNRNEYGSVLNYYGSVYLNVPFQLSRTLA